MKRKLITVEKLANYKIYFSGIADIKEQNDLNELFDTLSNELNLSITNADSLGLKPYPIYLYCDNQHTIDKLNKLKFFEKANIIFNVFANN